MDEWVMCKSCGYVMKKSRLNGKCPACGVPDKMFIPYAQRVSDVRRRLLAMDIHPVMVHFTQAFLASIPVLCVIALLAGPVLSAYVTSTITVLGVALPFVIALTIAAGILDGKIRFRRIITPLLRTKIILSIAVFCLSVGALVALLANQPLDQDGLAWVLVLCVPALVCSSILGIIGVRLLNSSFPG